MNPKLALPVRRVSKNGNASHYPTFLGKCIVRYVKTFKVILLHELGPT
jgi:hypothetical protein